MVTADEGPLFVSLVLMQDIYIKVIAKVEYLSLFGSSIFQLVDLCVFICNE